MLKKKNFNVLYGTRRITRELQTFGTWSWRELDRIKHMTQSGCRVFWDIAERLLSRPMPCLLPILVCRFFYIVINLFAAPCSSYVVPCRLCPPLPYNCVLRNPQQGPVSVWTY